MKERGIAADARAAAADARAAEADKQLAKVDAAKACFEFVKKGVAEKSFTKEDVLASVGGRITIENACAAANKFGFDRRAANAQPVVR